MIQFNQTRDVDRQAFAVIRILRHDPLFQAREKERKHGYDPSCKIRVEICGKYSQLRQFEALRIVTIIVVPLCLVDQEI